MLHPSKKFIGVETLKAYNPSTAHRRKERDAEKKKNKAERKVTREQALLKKNPVAIKEELDKLEAMAKTGQPMTDGRSRRLQKLQQLWAQVVSSVEAERRVRTADVSSIAAADSRSSNASTAYPKCLQQRLSHGERAPEEDERRYYCPELCNTDPDGSVRPYPPLVANDKSEQRRKFVESQQRQTRDRRGVSRDSDASSDSESEDDMPSSAAPGGKKKPSAEAAQSAEAAEDFLASIPLPAEPPPPDSASATAIQAAEEQMPSAPASMPFIPLPFPVPPAVAYSGAAPQQGAGTAQAAPSRPAAFLPQGFIPPFVGIPAPPSQLLAQMQQHLPAQPQQNTAQHHQQQQQRLVPSQQHQQQPSVAAAPHNVQKRPTVLRTPVPPAKKQQAGSKPADAADLKAAIAFVPTHLRTKKLPATAKMQEGPSISRVSAYSMGVGALGRQVGASGSSANGEATSGLTRFLGGARKQQGEAISGTPQTAGPADLDRAFDEFLKEVGAS